MQDASKNNAEASIGRAAFTLKEFCRRNCISRPTYYKLKAQGLGPREFRTGRVVRIFVDAEIAWQRARNNPEAAERAAIAQDAIVMKQRSAHAVAGTRHVASARRQQTTDV